MFRDVMEVNAVWQTLTQLDQWRIVHGDNLTPVGEMAFKELLAQIDEEVEDLVSRADQKIDTLNDEIWDLRNNGKGKDLQEENEHLAATVGSLSNEKKSLKRALTTVEKEAVGYKEQTEKLRLKLKGLEEKHQNQLKLMASEARKRIKALDDQIFLIEEGVETW